jgi:hypothetical protein
MRNWKLLHGHMKIVDRVKSALLGDMAGAEWEVLDEREWVGESGVTETTDPRSKAAAEEGGKRIGSKGEGGETVGGDGVPETKTKPGTSGWTKLKSR